MENYLHNPEELTHVQHRAVCRESEFAGPWRDDINQAFNDADAHQRVHGDHTVDIITRQTVGSDSFGI